MGIGYHVKGEIIKNTPIKGRPLALAQSINHKKSHMIERLYE